MTEECIGLLHGSICNAATAEQERLWHNCAPVLQTHGALPCKKADSERFGGRLVYVVQVVGYTLARPAREVLFTVVPREEMYKAKICIDTLVVRGGDMVAAALYHLLDGQYHLGERPKRQEGLQNLYADVTRTSSGRLGNGNCSGTLTEP